MSEGFKTMWQRVWERVLKLKDEVWERVLKLKHEMEEVFQGFQGFLRLQN